MAQPQPYYAIEGNDNGLSVVFVHGMGVDHRSLMMLDEAFDGNDSIRRIYLDLPGFGRTPALPENACGLPEMADWLQTVIDGLVGKATPFAMVGNSMGGALVREVLAREPRRVAGMALIAPVVDPQHAGRHVAEHVVANPNPRLTHSLPQEQVFDFITMGVNQSFDAWRRYQRFILPGVALCDRSAWNDWINAIGWMTTPRKHSAHMQVRCSSSPANKTRSSDTKTSKPCCRTISTPPS